MGEADTLGVEFDNSRPGGLLERVQNLGPLAVRGDQGLDRRPRERGGEEQHVAADRWQPSEAGADDLVARLPGTGSGRPGAGGASAELAADLQREERVASGHLAQLRQLRRESSTPRRCLRIWNSAADASGPTESRVGGAGREPALELARFSANGEQRADALVTQPTEREQERPRRRSIEPLEVVDRDEDRRVRCERREDCRGRRGRPRAARQHCRRRILRSAAPLSSARRRSVAQRRQQLVGHDRAEQLGDPGEGEDSLGLDRAVREDAAAACARALESRLPERRLADPRLPREHERGGRATARSRKSSIDRVRPRAR